MKYKVKSAIRKDGIQYDEGSMIELTAEEKKLLLDCIEEQDPAENPGTDEPRKQRGK